MVSDSESCESMSDRNFSESFLKNLDSMIVRFTNRMEEKIDKKFTEMIEMIRSFTPHQQTPQAVSSSVDSRSEFWKIRERTSPLPQVLVWGKKPGSSADDGNHEEDLNHQTMEDASVVVVVPEAVSSPSSALVVTTLTKAAECTPKEPMLFMKATFDSNCKHSLHSNFQSHEVDTPVIDFKNSEEKVNRTLVLEELQCDTVIVETPKQICGGPESKPYVSCLNCLDYFCSSSVRQNVYMLFGVDLPPAKPPDTLLTLCQSEVDRCVTLLMNSKDESMRRIQFGKNVSKVGGQLDKDFSSWYLSHSLYFMWLLGQFLHQNETMNESHSYTVGGYSIDNGMEIGKNMVSDPFMVGGYTWAIYLYPNLKNGEDNAAFVSLFTALVSEGSNVNALFELSLLNQSGKERHKVHGYFNNRVVQYEVCCELFLSTHRELGLSSIQNSVLFLRPSMMSGVVTIPKPQQSSEYCCAMEHGEMVAKLFQKIQVIVEEEDNLVLVLIDEVERLAAAGGAALSSSKDLVVCPFTEKDTHALERLIMQILLLVKNPDYERIDWNNKCLEYMWLYLEKAICKMAKNTAKSFNAEQIPKCNIDYDEFEDLTLGSLPPTFQGMKVYIIDEKELFMEPSLWAANPNILVDSCVQLSQNTQLPTTMPSLDTPVKFWNLNKCKLRDTLIAHGCVGFMGQYCCFFKTKTIYIKTFGCPYTKSGSEYMVSQLSAFGYILSENSVETDFWLINTLITRCKKAKTPLLVAGCVPQKSRDMKELEGIRILGVQQIVRVDEVIEETLKGHEVRLFTRKTLLAPDLPKTSDEIHFFGHTKGYIQVRVIGLVYDLELSYSYQTCSLNNSNLEDKVLSGGMVCYGKLVLVSRA